MAKSKHYDDDYSNIDNFVDSKYSKYSGGKQKHVPRCYESHPTLKIGDYEIEGGSCALPMHKDADVYIGFDWSMALTPPQYPWETPKPPKTTEVYFHIPDGGIPAKPEDFKKLVNWTAEQLKAGKKVHAGCIGGHGRTGMFLAALVTVMTGNKDSIKYVRETYCTKAVESKIQVSFLNLHFGITPREGSKEFLKQIVDTSKGLTSPLSAVQHKLPAGASSSKKAITPVASMKNIWRAPAANV